MSCDSIEIQDIKIIPIQALHILKSICTPTKYKQLHFHTVNVKSTTTCADVDTNYAQFKHIENQNGISMVSGN